MLNVSGFNRITEQHTRGNTLSEASYHVANGPVEVVLREPRDNEDNQCRNHHTAAFANENIEAFTIGKIASVAPFDFAACSVVKAEFGRSGNECY